MTARTTIPATQKSIDIARLPLGVHLPLGRLTFLRKTVSAIAGEEDDFLHNHADRERVIYRYPMVQYKSLFGGAGLLGVGEDGCRSLENLTKKADFSDIFAEDGFLSIEKEQLDLRLGEQIDRAFSIQNWLPFNDKNYQTWAAETSLVRRAALLETCLTGHVLKFCSAIGWLLPPKSLRVELEDARLLPKARELHGAKFRAVFDARFRANIDLPEAIGLGKGVAHGLGTVFKIGV